MTTASGDIASRISRGAVWTSPARRRGLVLLSASMLALALTACGGAGDDGGGTAETSASVIAEAKAAVAKNREGTDRALPISAPKPQAGQNVWLISCSQAGEGCSAPAEGAEEAAAVVGWDLTIVDGKGRPDVFASAIRSAVADDADGIILDAIDCIAAKSALQDARKAGTKIFAFYAFDCNDPILKDQSEPLFDAELSFGNGVTFIDYVEKVQSRSAADYIIAQTEGKAKIIEFTEDDLVITQHLKKGFEDRIKDCEGCEIVKKVPFNLDDFVTGKLGGKAEAALTQNPDANVLYSPYDSALTVGIAQAVVASGRNDDILVTGNEGLTPNIGFTQDNKGQDFITGLPARWVGWAAIDSMNRLLQGEPQVDQGLGLQNIDEKGPFPTQTSFYDGNMNPDGTPKQDYAANFKKIWDVS